MFRRYTNPCLESNCDASCCRKHRIALQINEGVPDPFEGQPGVIHSTKGWKVLENGCPLVTDDGLCPLFNSPQRPEVCGTFKIGSPKCAVARLERGRLPL